MISRQASCHRSRCSESSCGCAAHATDEKWRLEGGSPLPPRRRSRTTALQIPLRSSPVSSRCPPSTGSGVPRPVPPTTRQKIAPIEVAPKENRRVTPRPPSHRRADGRTGGGAFSGGSLSGRLPSSRDGIRIGDDVATAKARRRWAGARSLLAGEKRRGHLSLNGE